MNAFVVTDKAHMHTNFQTEVTWTGRSLGTATAKQPLLTCLCSCRRAGRTLNPWAVQGQSHIPRLWTS